MKSSLTSLAGDYVGAVRLTPGPPGLTITMLNSNGLIGSRVSRWWQNRFSETILPKTFYGFLSKLSGLYSGGRCRNRK
jgi:hypothetical protein